MIVNQKMNYDLKISKVIEHIKDKKPNSVLIQLPDGLKPKAQEITNQIQAETEAKVFIYLGSCYGACDIPTNVNVDLVIQFGHSDWIL